MNGSVSVRLEVRPSRLWVVSGPYELWERRQEAAFDLLLRTR